MLMSNIDLTLSCCIVPIDIDILQDSRFIGVTSGLVIAIVLLLVVVVVLVIVSVALCKVCCCCCLLIIFFTFGNLYEKLFGKFLS